MCKLYPCPQGRPLRSPVGGEIGEAPPVADEASRFRGSAPIDGHDSARQSVGTTVGKRAPPLRKRNKNYGEAGHRGRRPLQGSIGKRSVGDDAYIVPPSSAIKLSVGADASVRPPTTHRTPCNVSLRDQFANWSWQSVPKAPCLKGTADRGILFPHRTHGRARGPCPRKYVVVGRDPCVPPPHALLVMCHCEPVTDVTGVAIRAPVPKAPLPKGFLQEMRCAGRCGERTERCQWQMKRSERVAAVKISSVRRKAAWKFWAPQQGHPHSPSYRPPLGKGALG